jgi:hypothetical protein
MRRIRQEYFAIYWEYTDRHIKQRLSRQIFDQNQQFSDPLLQSYRHDRIGKKTTHTTVPLKLIIDRFSIWSKKWFGFLTCKNLIFQKQSSSINEKLSFHMEPDPDQSYWIRIRNTVFFFITKLYYILCTSIRNYKLHACFAMLVLSLGTLCCDLISEMPRFLFPALRTLRSKNKMFS